MSRDTEDKLQDLATYGVSFSKRGQRIDPRDVYISAEQKPEESVYQKLLRIEDGIEVEILPSELWLDGYEAGKRSALLSKQPEQTKYIKTKKELEIYFVKDEFGTLRPTFKNPKETPFCIDVLHGGG